MPKIPVLTPFQQHKSDWSSCTECSLCNDRKQVVHLRGSIPADVLFIGEGPGDSEDVLGKPFCGPAGSLLDSMIEIASRNVDPYKSAFINCVGCIPKENGNKIGEPRPDQLEACLPKMLELIRMIRPWTIVAVGRVAKDWLQKNHAQVLLCFPKGHPLNVQHCLHPAAILKSGISQRGLLIQQTIADLEAILIDQQLPF